MLVTEKWLEFMWGWRGGSFRWEVLGYLQEMITVDSSRINLSSMYREPNRQTEQIFPITGGGCYSVAKVQGGHAYLIPKKTV